jgi:tetratricopeptide (TPR) repeat protein
MATYETMGDRIGMEVARSGLVAAYMQAPRYDEAIESARRALTFFQAMGDSFWIALNASNLAEALVELGNYAEAESYTQVVLAEEEPHSHPYALFTLGRIRQGQGSLAEAELVMNQARAIAEMNEDRYLLAYCWEELGKIQRAVGNPNGAAASFAQALDLFESLKIEAKVAALRDLIQNSDA